MSHMVARKPYILVLSALWLAGVVFGLRVFARAMDEEGAPADAPLLWPTTVDLPRAPGAATVVMVVHPKCVCAKASVAELNRLLTRHAGKAVALVLFVRPEGQPEGWERTDLWDTVATMPGARAISDPGGVISHAFGSTTAGHTLLFDAAGTRLFEGGLTAGRGEEGRSAGTDAIDALLRGLPADAANTSVFGCPIQAPPQST